MTDSYYELIDDADALGEKFRATDLVRSTWTAAIQHAGRVGVAGSCAGAVPTARRHPAVPGRHRLAGPGAREGDLWVRPQLQRSKQIELVSAEMLAPGPDGQPRPVARASGWRLQQLDTQALAHAAAPLPRPPERGPRPVASRQGVWDAITSTAWTGDG